MAALTIRERHLAARRPGAAVLSAIGRPDDQGAPFSRPTGLARGSSARTVAVMTKTSEIPQSSPIRFRGIRAAFLSALSRSREERVRELAEGFKAVDLPVERAR